MIAKINSNSIVATSEKSYLIKIPKKDRAFWYPKRFCSFEGKSDYILKIWAGDNFTIKTFSHENKRDKNYEEENFSDVFGEANYV